MQKENGFQTLLRQKGLKYTFERKCIYDHITRTKGHFDADGLYETVKKDNARIARGTVYRTIPLLLESGVIQPSVGQGKGEFFEKKSSHGHHDHMICVACGRVYEFQCEPIEKLQDEVCAKYGAVLVFHDHKLFVRCSDCRQQDRPADVAK